MKSIIAIIVVVVGTTIATLGALGDLFTAIDFFNVAKPAVEGNITGTIEKGSYFLQDYVISAAYWTLGIAIFCSLLAIFGIKIKSR